MRPISVIEIAADRRRQASRSAIGCDAIGCFADLWRCFAAHCAAWQLNGAASNPLFWSRRRQPVPIQRQRTAIRCVFSAGMRAVHSPNNADGIKASSIEYSQHASGQSTNKREDNEQIDKKIEKSSRNHAKSFVYFGLCSQIFCTITNQRCRQIMSNSVVAGAIVLVFDNGHK